MLSTRIRSIGLLITAAALTWGLLIVRQFAVPAIPGTWSMAVALDRQFKYQLLTVGLAALFLLLAWAVKPAAFAAYLRFGTIDAPAKSNRIFGIKTGESWRGIGWKFTAIITLVTAVIIWFQEFQGGTFSLAPILLWVPLLSALNAFTEEILTRFGVVVALDGILSPDYIAIASGVLFGTVHYFGTPSGIIGVLVAGLLGWLLARSVLETKGLFWAWFIHFLQDVVIIGTLLLDL